MFEVVFRSAGEPDRVDSRHKLLSRASKAAFKANRALEKANPHDQHTTLLCGYVVTECPRHA